MTFKKPKNKLWHDVKFGRGSTEAAVISPPKLCNHCGETIYFAKRKSGSDKPFPIHKEKKNIGGQEVTEWKAHHIFCPVNGVLAKQTGQKPML